MLYPVELGVRGLRLPQFGPPKTRRPASLAGSPSPRGGPIIMPENRRENKAGSANTVAFALTLDL